MQLAPSLNELAAELPMPKGMNGFGPRRAYRMTVFYPDGLCSYCGKRDRRMTADHVVPQRVKSKRRPHGFENLVPACWTCNGAKSDKPLLLFLLERAA